jgi:3-hydroxybutyryl-CoA dehydrogenase
MPVKTQIQVIGVIGAGTMGQGIGYSAAIAGYKVILFDLSSKIAEEGVIRISSILNRNFEKGKISKEVKERSLQSISTTTDLSTLVADLFIEAVVEKIEVKKDVFRTIQKNNPDAILATNTSSIPVSQIAGSLNDPSKLVGMHFFNPAHIMKLVEIICGATTDPDIANTVIEVAEKMGKVAVSAKDFPGFIVNRVARHFYVESLKILEEKTASVEEIDVLLEASGFRMGPFRLMDLIGVDTNFAVTKTVFEQFYQDGKFRPSRIQQQLVEAGHTGRKSGKGFYKYS